MRIYWFFKVCTSNATCTAYAAEVIDTTRRRQTRDNELVSIEDSTVFLKVRVPGERHYREIPFGRARVVCRFE